ncbi:MAG: Trk family potassium uptake protein [Eubacterium sp.]|jgi:trk system potassium uptake protein TrkH|nr:Trk family potassium uptake protein [Eubacterium sp.]
MKRIIFNFEHMKPVQIIILGFLSVILLGTLLLMLPAASRGAGSAGFADALFTATSATCVTGLIVQDTFSFWTPFGQAVILGLIQIGGLGVITVALSIAMLSGKKIGLIQRNIMQESISAPQISGIVKFTKFILLTTFGTETIGALVMMPVFIRSFGLPKGIWFAVFHSISAFCNAGFDLMGGTQKYSSLTAFAGNPVINITIMALIIFGGIGFLTWMDMAIHKFQFRKYRMQTKVVLFMTAILIAVPALYFYFGEFSGASSHRLLLSLFQAVTPRTAGFNTADLTKFSDTGLFITILLMLIGGSPASTAGGMKTTTIAVLFASSTAVFKRKKYTGLFGRRISMESIQNAGAILLLYISLFSVAGMVISRVEGIPLIRCLFETASAIGTVGLTTGITPGLSLLSRGILVFLMYVGRVGGLTLIFATVSAGSPGEGTLPEEKITVG